MTAAVAEADGERRKAEVLVRDDEPRLLAALKEMKDGHGVDLVMTKVKSIARKPVIMDDKRSKDDLRREKALARMASNDPYLKEMVDEAGDRPEDWKETAGDESKEFLIYMRQRQKQEQREEGLSIRVPVTKREKQMKKQLHGLQGLITDDGMNMLLDGDTEGDGGYSKSRSRSAGWKRQQKGGKKRKRH